MGQQIKTEKEILLWDWDDLLLPGILARSVQNLWSGPGTEVVADYSLPSEWDELVEHFWGEENGRASISLEQIGLLQGGVHLLPNISSVLEELSQRWRLFVAGSAENKTVATSLELLDWQDLFEEQAGGEDLLRGKPSAEIYLRILDRAGASEEDAFVIVGSRRGAEAASRGGLAYMLLANPQIALSDQIARQANKIFWDPSELLRYL